MKENNSAVKITFEYRFKACRKTKVSAAVDLRKLRD